MMANADRVDPMILICATSVRKSETPGIYATYHLSSILIRSDFNDTGRCLRRGADVMFVVSQIVC